MFSKQRTFVPKSIAKPKVKIREVPVSTSKPRTPVNGSSSSHTPSRSVDPKGRPSAGRSSSFKTSSTSSGIKRSADGRPRASDSPFASSADENGYLAPPFARKRIRSPTTDSDRVAFDDSDDDSADDDNWENELKRHKPGTRIDPDRKLRSVALTELADGGYKDTGKKLKFVHAADVVSLKQGDEKCFPDASLEELVLELQYPGSLTRER